MDEKELIKQISRLKEIKPREDWVILTKKRILEKEALQYNLPLHKRRFSGIFELVSLFPKYLGRPALVMPVLAVLVAGGLVWQASTKSLPGDTLYAIKAVTEQTVLKLSSEEKRPFLQIELTQKRLSELARITENNQIKNLPSAIREFEITASELSGSLNKIVENHPEKALQVGKIIVKLQEDKSKVEKALGTKLNVNGEDELDAGTQFVKEIVEDALADENSFLTPEQQELLELAQQAYEEGDYHAAFEKVWLASNESQEEN